MPPGFTTANLTRFLRGVVLQGLPDAIPDDALRLAENVRTDLVLGALTPRPGWTRQTIDATPLGTPGGGIDVHWLGKRYGVSGDDTYAQVGDDTYRLNAAWRDPVLLFTDSDQTLSDANYIDGKGGIWKYLVNNETAVKDNGVSTLPIGIPAPTAAPSAAVLATDLFTQIDAFNATTGWTGAGLASGPTVETTIKQQSTGSLTFTVAPGTIGSLTKAITVNLDTLAGGDDTVKVDDYIHIWVRISRPEWVEYMQLDFDLDGVTFAENYYSVRLPIQTRFNLGTHQWTKVQVRKAEFSRFGDSVDDWGDVAGVRVSFLVATQTDDVDTPVTFYVDDLKLRGGFGIEGEVTYTVTYRNSATGARGNPPQGADDAVLYTTPLKVDRQRVTLTLTNVAQGGGAHPGDTQITHLMLWRRTGIFAAAVLLDEIVDTLTTYTDDTADATLVAAGIETLEVDNNLPPSGDTRILFGPDASGHLFMIVDGHRIYFSKPFEADENRAENWPSEQYMLIGDGSQRALGGLCTDTETFVWTESQTYQIVGAGAETFLPVAIPNSHECVGRFAMSAGGGSVYFVANDGVYEQRGLQQIKLTEAIDPFFNGRTVSETIGLPKDPVLRAAIRLAYYPDPESDMLFLIYQERFLVLKRYGPSGMLTEAFFGWSAHAHLKSLLVDPESNVLYAGGDNGHVYQVEDQTALSDVGAAIRIDVMTKSLDFQAPAQRKKIASVHVEANTLTLPLDIRAVYNRGVSPEVLGTLNTNGQTAVGYFPTADPEARRDDLAVRITGSVERRVVISRLACAYAVVPELFTYLDSDVLTFPDIRQLKYLEFNILCIAEGVVDIYVDGALVNTQPLFAHPEQRVFRHYVPTGMKGYTWRVTVRCLAPFELYGCRAYMKALGTTHGYTPQELRFAA